MTEAIVFPDVEQFLVDYLPDAIHDVTGQTVDAQTKAPNGLGFRILRTGGVRLSLVVDQPTVVVEAWSEDTKEAPAIALLGKARALIHALEGTRVNGVGVYNVGEIGGPTNFSDADSGRARYTLTLSMLLRGFAL